MRIRNALAGAVFDEEVAGVEPGAGGVEGKVRKAYG
jgi:hypothetical protein